ncbi:MAG TPA: NUDIX hydrolase [Candidatus Pacearchaeota archaeon]|nr:NUDIX hydrolase [Candidatus Pacearchaeota archaeon]
MKKIGVSQKAIIFNREGKILVLRRSGTALSNPGKWDFPGGDLEFGEDAIGGIIREIREETGLEVKNLNLFDVESHINKEGDFWVTIAYIAKAVSDKVILSYEHDEFKWLTAEDFLKLESSEKLRRFVGNLTTH